VSLFALPHVGRAGLGNALFPWARAELFARRSGACVLAPHWAGFRFGPYLRREPDKRHYSRFFRSAHHTCGYSRLLIATMGRHVSEEHLDEIPIDGRQFFRPCIVEFSGIGDLFIPLLREHRFIRNQLWNMTTPSMRVTGIPYGGNFIAMHVRRGDITRQGFTQQQLREVNQYTPISWFISMVRAARCEKVLRSVPIVVFTDGSDEEVAELLALEGVLLHRRRAAITDLWLLSHSSLLFASGFSTFSMWASFLGGMPTIYAPGKLKERVQTGLPSLEIELPEDAAIPPDAIIRIASAA
jgi:hypothetical protein